MPRPSYGNEYNASVGYAVRDLGTVYLNSGNQAFKFTVAGKNASSTGYTLAFDYIELVPGGRGSHAGQKSHHAIR